MKCTTKILIGILLSGVVVVVVGSLLLSTISGSNDKMLFVGKSVQMDVAPFRVVNVLVEAGELLKKDRIFIEGNLSILPTTGGRNVLSYPEGLEHYLSVVTKNDTLNLVFKISEYNVPDEYKDKEWLYLNFSTIKLTADSSLVAAHSEACRLSVHLKQIKADSMALSSSYLQVDSCDLRSLSVKDSWRLELKNSQICNAYLDLDGMHNWNVVNCQVENEYLTGSGEHRNELQQGECRQMYWKPKNKDAQLRVTLWEEAKVLLTN